MNNIPAFPVFPETGSGHASAFQGMTLRDYFAAKAMVELMGTEEISVCCESAYRWADAMMEAREA